MLERVTFVLVCQGKASAGLLSGTLSEEEIGKAKQLGKNLFVWSIFPDRVMHAPSAPAIQTAYAVALGCFEIGRFLPYASQEAVPYLNESFWQVDLTSCDNLTFLTDRLFSLAVRNKSKVFVVVAGANMVTALTKELYRSFRPNDNTPENFKNLHALDACIFETVRDMGEVKAVSSFHFR